MKDINHELEEIKKTNQKTRKYSTTALILSGVSLGFALSSLLKVILAFIFSK